MPRSGGAPMHAESHAVLLNWCPKRIRLTIILCTTLLKNKGHKMQAYLLANLGTHRAKNFNRDKMLTTAVVATDRTTRRKIVDCRVYIGKSSSSVMVYCSIWIYGERVYNGLGKAGGGGYHKASAAMYEALHNAGWTVSEPISGRGDGAMRDAAVAVAQAVAGHDDIILTVID